MFSIKKIYVIRDVIYYVIHDVNKYHKIAVKEECPLSEQNRI